MFLGHKQYFVASDVGAGKMQWYAFHKEPPGGVDGPQGIFCFDNLEFKKSQKIFVRICVDHRCVFLCLCIYIV